MTGDLDPATDDGGLPLVGRRPTSRPARVLAGTMTGLGQILEGRTPTDDTVIEIAAPDDEPLGDGIDEIRVHLPRSAEDL